MAMATDLEFRDRAVYLPETETLVVADLHLGRDAASPVELPLGERADLRDRLETLLAAFSPARVVVAGDVLHAFDRVPDGVAASLSDLGTLVADADATLVLVAGNHDRQLAAVVADDSTDPDAAPVPAPERSFRVGDTLVLHGHETPRDDGSRAERPARYVVGHDHPAIEIEGVRRPCALVGEGVYRGADVVMLPAFTRLAPGVAVNRLTGAEFQSPLVADPDAFRPVVWDDDAGEPLWFPPLGEFRRLL